MNPTPPTAPSPAWQDISTAPRDGTPFIWLHYITILHTDKPHEYQPQTEVVRRHWVREDEVGRRGDGFWMGQYVSIPDSRLSRGWWHPLNPHHPTP